MEKVIITGEHFLVEGGCNACGLKNTSTYTLYFKGQNGLVLGDLDVENLVSTIALKHQWKPGYESVGIGEEAPIFEKEGTKILVSEVGHHLKYSNEKTYQSVLADNTICNAQTLFEKTNEVLAKVFNIEPLDFSIED